MQMLGFSGQLLRVAMQMLGFSGQLLRSCYADVGVFWAVAKELLCRCWGFLGSC